MHCSSGHVGPPSDGEENTELNNSRTATEERATNQLLIRADAAQGRITRYIYGHFAEHLGRCIYGGFWVGGDADVPNTRGIRSDVVEALRKIAPPILRWPGGCFADEYHWRDGIGPREGRPATVNTYWGGVTETNHFGTHEFLDLCDQLGCEPYISANVGSGSVREMQEWLQYLTYQGRSALTDLRRANGREDPWPIRFWGVGNESWGCGGSMRPEYYADLFRRYAAFCRNYSQPPLYKIACGAGGDDYKWTEVVMREAGSVMDGLSLHHYTVPGTWAAKGSATQFDESEWFVTMRKALQIDELVTRHSEIMDLYDPEGKVGLIVDEWGAWYDVAPGMNAAFLHQQNTLRDALVAGVTLNILNSHCQRVYMANLAQTVNVLQAVVHTEGERMLVTPTYHVFEMYKQHQDAALLPVEVDSQPYRHGDEAIPAVSASASRDEEGKVLLTLCNLDHEREIGLSCRFAGFEPTSVDGRVLTAEAMNAHNTFDEPERVSPQPFAAAALSGDCLDVTLPAKSVAALQIE
jgi:alpha-N-arabinofuranosidase